MATVTDPIILDSTGQDIVTALNNLNTPRDTAAYTTSFASSDTDDASATSWTVVPPIAGGETHATLFGKLSQIAKNVRYLYKTLGTPVEGTLTFIGNWGGSQFQLHKVAKQVTLYFTYQTGFNTNFTSGKIATLPEGFRPDASIYIPAVKFNSVGLVPTGHGYIVCNANGDVYYYGDAFAFQERIFVNGSFVIS